MKFVSGVSLATTFDGEFSDVTRSYAGRRVARHACWRRTSGVWHLTDVDVLANVRFAPAFTQAKEAIKRRFDLSNSQFSKALNAIKATLP